MVNPALLRDLEVELKIDEGTGPMINGHHVVYDDATGKPVRKGSTLIGNPTVGYGRELSMNGVNEDEAVALLDGDCIGAAQDCASRYSWFTGLPEQAQLVMASAVFNMGAAKFAQFRDTQTALAGHQFANAADCLLDSAAARELPARYGRYAQILRALALQVA